MGAILEDLDGHEGYPLRQLPDRSVTSTVTSETSRFAAYVPACDCGWQGAGRYQPTEAGYDAALDEWEHDHARPLLERTIPNRVQHLLHDTLRALNDLAADRPHAAAKALRQLDPGLTAVARQLGDRLLANEPLSRRRPLLRAPRDRGLDLGL